MNHQLEGRLLDRISTLQSQVQALENQFEASELPTVFPDAHRVAFRIAPDTVTEWKENNGELPFDIEFVNFIGFKDFDDENNDGINYQTRGTFPAATRDKCRALMGGAYVSSKRLIEVFVHRNYYVTTDYERVIQVKLNEDIDAGNDGLATVYDGGVATNDTITVHADFGGIDYKEDEELSAVLQSNPFGYAKYSLFKGGGVPTCDQLKAVFGAETISAGDLAVPEFTSTGCTHEILQDCPEETISAGSVTVSSESEMYASGMAVVYRDDQSGTRYDWDTEILDYVVGQTGYYPVDYDGVYFSIRGISPSGTQALDNREIDNKVDVDLVNSNCRSFNGTASDHLSASTPSSIEGTSARTFLYLLNIGTFGNAIHSYGTAASGQLWTLTAESSQLAVDINGCKYITTGTALTTNTWYRVAVVVPDAANASDIEIYIDDVDRAPVLSTGSDRAINTATGTNTYIARDGTGNYADIDIAFFGSYAEEMSSITRAFWWNNIIPLANMAQGFPFAEGAGSTAYDISGNSNNGTLTGSSSSTQDVLSYNLQYGFRDESGTFVPALRDGTNAANGSALTNAADSNKHNGAETQIDFSTFGHGLYSHGDAVSGSLSKQTSGVYEYEFKIAASASSGFITSGTFVIDDGTAVADGVFAFDDGTAA